ncbi:MAG: response regulator [Desulfuromonadales bacterium]|nr:response regulator [Desulfuromonadales bacterium]
MAQVKSRFSGETILVVDDEDVIVELTTLLLKKRGFKVLCASNGKECLQLVKECRPALALVDYMMPVMNGLDALKAIRRDYPDTYVLMFTGKGSEEIAVEAMKAGAVDYLQKPFVNQNLCERIEAVLLRREVELENHRLIVERELLQREIQQWNSELEKRVRQKSAELEQAHKDIIQSEKLAAFGHVSAGMAHEIRNPLNSINLLAQILLSADDISVDNKNYITRITHEVERIDSILVQMLASSRSSEKSHGKVDLVQMIDRVLSSAQHQIKAQQIELDIDVDRQAPHFRADRLEMEQIFTNLISNALYEMPHGGCLSVSLKSDAEKLVIVVSDTGPGIPRENIDRIFDPFFTTKEKGTGFGLSVVRRIVTGCGGKIKAENQGTGGACFTIQLPLLPDAVH